MTDSEVIIFTKPPIKKRTLYYFNYFKGQLMVQPENFVEETVEFEFNGKDLQILNIYLYHIFIFICHKSNINTHLSSGILHTYLIL